MKLILLLINSLLLFLPLSAQNKTSFDDLKFEWELYELDNGLRVLLQQDPEAETVSIELWTDSGAKHEITGRYGMAHFFEHATPYGLNTKDEKRKALLDNLTGSNAQVQMDFTTYYLETTETYLPLAIEYVADRFKEDPNTYIIDRRTEYHRENVLAEVERNSKWPTFGVNARTTRYTGIFGPHHPYGHGAYGYIEDNKRITTDELRRWYRANFRPEYSTLFIVGNFDKEKVKEEIANQFASIEGGERVKEIERRATLTKGGTQKISTNYEGCYLSLSWATPHWNSEEAMALELASRIIEQRLSGYAEQDSTLEDAGSLMLTNFYQLAGYFGVHASFESEDSEEQIRTILEKKVQKFISAGVRETELEQAKKEAMESIENQVSKLGFIGSRTRLMGTSLFFTGDPDAYAKRLEKQMELTRSEVNSVIRGQLTKPHFELLLTPKVQKTGGVMR